MWLMHQLSWKVSQGRESGVFTCNNMEMWTPSQVFCSSFLGDLPLCLLSCSTSAVRIVAIVGVWDMAVLSVLFVQCESALLRLYPSSSWKVSLFRLLPPPPPPCVRLDDYNVCGRRNGVSVGSFPHPVRRDKMHGPEWYPALPFSDEVFTPPPPAPCSGSAGHYCFLSPAHPQTQRASGGDKEPGAFWEPHLCVHSEGNFNGEQMLNWIFIGF